MRRAAFGHPGQHEGAGAALVPPLRSRRAAGSANDAPVHSVAPDDQGGCRAGGRRARRPVRGARTRPVARRCRPGTGCRRGRGQRPSRPSTVTLGDAREARVRAGLERSCGPCQSPRPRGDRRGARRRPPRPRRIRSGGLLIAGRRPQARGHGRASPSAPRRRPAGWRSCRRPDWSKVRVRSAAAGAVDAEPPRRLPGASTDATRSSRRTLECGRGRGRAGCRRCRSVR